MKLVFLDFLYNEAFALIELQAQIWNNTAYNLIELRLSPQHPASSQGEKAKAMILIENAIQAVKVLLSFTSPSSQLSIRLRRDLAYYLDTKGWFHYRLARLVEPKGGAPRTDEGDNDSTGQAYIYLDGAMGCLQEALQYDQRSAVIYYHAARVNLALFEQAWRATTIHNKQTQELSAGDSDRLDGFLVALHHYWKQASLHDYRGRFKSDLAWLGLRLNEYRNMWSKRQQ